MQPLLAMDEGLVIPVLAIGGAFVVAILGIVFGTLKSVMETRSREATKRELAAYVAEGSMAPEDAERIVKADMPHSAKGCKR